MDPLVVFPPEVRGVMRMQLALHATENNLDQPVLPGPDVFWQGYDQTWFEEHNFGPVSTDPVVIAAHERAIAALNIVDAIPEGADQLFKPSGDITIFTLEELKAGYGDS
jgi:hypothetical protein